MTFALDGFAFYIDTYAFVRANIYEFFCGCLVHSVQMYVCTCMSFKTCVNVYASKIRSVLRRGTKNDE